MPSTNSCRKVEYLEPLAVWCSWDADEFCLQSLSVVLHHTSDSLRLDRDSDLTTLVGARVLVQAAVAARLEVLFQATTYTYDNHNDNTFIDRHVYIKLRRSRD